MQKIEKGKQKILINLIIIFATLFLVFSTSTIVYALVSSQKNVDSGINVEFIRDRYVLANVEGASYLVSGGQEIKIEDLEPVSFNSDLYGENTSSKTANFKEPITVLGENDYAIFEFEISNLEYDFGFYTERYYRDLVICPQMSYTGENAIQSEACSTFSFYYYSEADKKFNALVDKYVTVPLGGKITLRVLIRDFESLYDHDLPMEGNISIALHTETKAPEDYVPNYEYSILSGKAYRAKIYTDGTVGRKIRLYDNQYIIASADKTAENYAQKVLDGDINNKIVIFDEGVYDEILEFRPSKDTAKIYKATYRDFELGEEVEGDLLPTDTACYVYVRDYSNVILAGTSGAKFTNILELYSTPKFTTATRTMKDIIRGIDCREKTEDNRFPTYYSFLNIDGLKITGMNFEGADGRIALYSPNPYNKLKNITVTNCKFINDGTIASKPAISFETTFYKEDRFVNFNASHNEIKGYFQGVTILNAVNAKIYGNKISNTTHNAIACQSNNNNDIIVGPVAAFSGEILIKNNTISNTPDRAIRFGEAFKARIVVEDNTFSNCTENGSLLKAQLAKVEGNEGLDCYKYHLYFVNNTYNGNKLNTMLFADMNIVNAEVVVSE